VEIRFTKGNSNVMGYHKDLGKIPEERISMTLDVTELEKKLFCWSGTDIFVHNLISHNPQGTTISQCTRYDRCPICANKEYLESLGELTPRVTGNEEDNRHLALNYEHYRGEPVFVKNWLLLKNEFAYKYTPRCTQCGNPIWNTVIMGCDSWVDDVASGLCENCDPVKIEFSLRVKREMEGAKIPEKQSLLDQFFIKA
jgi:hypothetical protein